MISTAGLKSLEGSSTSSGMLSAPVYKSLIARAIKVCMCINMYICIDECDRKVDQSLLLLYITHQWMNIHVGGVHMGNHLWDRDFISVSYRYRIQTLPIHIIAAYYNRIDFYPFYWVYKR